MKKFISIICILAGVYAAFSVAIWRLNEGFSLRNIQSDLPLAISPQTAETSGLLDQNFYYVGKGSHCYVFESEDKQTVLKFFRHERLRLSKLESLTVFFSKNAQAKQILKQKKREALFKSCTIASQELSEESGILFSNLHKTAALKKTVIIFDKLKRAYPIDIYKYEFVLQTHAKHIYAYLKPLIDKNRKHEAKQALSHLAFIHAERLLKGIKDEDVMIHKNSGFAGNQAIFLDIGAFTKKPCRNVKKEMWDSTEELRAWLNAQDRELCSYFEHILDTL